MTITLHSFVDIYTRALDTAAHLLAKGEAFAAENDIAEADMFGWRLADDMNPLSFQLAVVVNFASGWIARAADLPVPDAVTGAELDLAGFKAAIASARTFVSSVSPEHLAGRDDAAITFKIGEIMEPTLPVERWIAGFATTNIHFHLSMIYAILRANGVPLGKIDMFPTGL